MNNYITSQKDKWLRQTFFYNRKNQQHLLEKLYESEFETQAMYGCLYSKVWLT